MNMLNSSATTALFSFFFSADLQAAIRWRLLHNTAFTRNRDAFQHNGMVMQGMAQTVHRMLSNFDPAIAAAKSDLAPTYTDLFLRA